MLDTDNDGVYDELDFCPWTPTLDEDPVLRNIDFDGDGLGTECDPNPLIPNKIKAPTDEEDLEDEPTRRVNPLGR